jgi:hypothetical protein
MQSFDLLMFRFLFPQSGLKPRKTSAFAKNQEKQAFHAKLTG